MSNAPRSDAQATGERARESLGVPEAISRESLPLPRASETTVREQPATPSQGLAPADTEARANFAAATHAYIREYIRVADQKATFFFTGATALLAFLYKNDVSSRWLKPPLEWNLLDIAAFIAEFALAAGALLALMVVVPRTPGSRRGYIFWEAIAEYANSRQYADDIGTLSPATLFQATAEHCFDLAGVCRTKYWWLRCALWVCGAGLLASLFVFLFLAGPATATAR